MSNWLNYHHLLYFRAIATEGSIARASEKLNVGQPSLSAQLKQLEETLGRKLFERKNRSLVLTEAGKIALEYANEIFQKGEEFMQVFNEESLAFKGRFKIAVSDSLPKSLAYQLMFAADQAVPDCFYSLEEGTPEAILEKVKSHQVDIALLNSGAGANQDGILSKLVGSSKVSIYGAKTFKNLQKGFPESLEGRPFILPTAHSKLRYDIEHAFKAAKIHHDLIAEVQDSSVKKLMAINGKGLVFLPEAAGNELVKDRKLIKIGSLPDLSEDYWLISAKRTLESPITDSLLKYFKVVD